MIYGLVAIVAGLFFVYRLIAGLIVQHRTAQIRAQNAQEQENFNQDVAKATEDIQNAKLRYDAAKRELGRDPT